MPILRLSQKAKAKPKPKVTPLDVPGAAKMPMVVSPLVKTMLISKMFENCPPSWKRLDPHVGSILEPFFLIGRRVCAARSKKTSC